MTDVNENTPDVSVIIGAYEAMPYLVKCLESVESQTLGADRIEIVAVDDGSTDGTGEYLEEFATRSKVATRVVRQSNSGGPSRPRNTGLALARGRFVFFLDADDYFGDEALERLVAMADRAGTDVVLGKTVGVNRNAAKSMWNETVERADIYRSNVKYTLSAQKLFRRDLLVRHGMRFDESLRTGEDALFTLEAYLRGNGVSVVSDPTCYYLVGREDGKHLTKTGGYVPRFDSARALMRLIAAHVPAGERRDLLMMRPFAVTLLPQFGPVVLRQPRDVLLAKMKLAAPLMAAHWTPGLARRLKTDERLRLTCVAMDLPDPLVDVVAFLHEGKQPERVRRRGREYLAYPHFRDPALGIPDSAYEVRGAPGPLTVARRRARRLADRTLRHLRRVRAGA
ncbi:glycosyltransferase family 2 protein [Streptomyces ficellus]|uniref:Glycosyltransferase family 2 protein n=1 Tax=Streptomyces ficellus TaxID=1977088 RepID=A0A6I6FTU9_9ACTN|nr:glycosyltransferase family 2 protein [Streptomyces ficellus]QGV80666.1 glycosyltransferase family 2 protein [Streptomyces ficellus]